MKLCKEVRQGPSGSMEEEDDDDEVNFGDLTILFMKKFAMSLVKVEMVTQSFLGLMRTTGKAKKGFSYSWSQTPYCFFKILIFVIHWYVEPISFCIVRCFYLWNWIFKWNESYESKSSYTSQHDTPAHCIFMGLRLRNYCHCHKGETTFLRCRLWCGLALWQTRAYKFLRVSIL